MQEGERERPFYACPASVLFCLLCATLPARLPCQTSLRLLLTFSPPLPNPQKCAADALGASSPLAASLERLALTAAAMARGARPPQGAWEEIADDLGAAAAAAARRAGAEERAAAAAQRADHRRFSEALAGLPPGR